MRSSMTGGAVARSEPRGTAEMAGDTARGPLFIVGFPRSGTTLVRALLSAHPLIAIAPETHFLNRFAKDVENLDLKTADRFLEFWSRFSGSDRFVDLGISPDLTRDRILASANYHLRNIFAIILREFADAAGKPIWGEKTPGHDRHIVTLLEWFPGARVIYVIRDPRAACASLLHAPWRTNPDSDKPSAAPGRVRRLQLLDEDAFFWQRSVERYRRDWARDPRVTLVRYEDLAARPESVLRDICAFIGVDYHPQMLDSRSRDDLPPPRAELNDKDHQNWRRAHIERARQTVTTDALAKWKAELSRLEVAVVEANCHRPMQAFGYEVGIPEDSRFARWSARLARIAVTPFLRARKRFAPPVV